MGQPWAWTTLPQKEFMEAPTPKKQLRPRGIGHFLV